MYKSSYPGGLKIPELSTRDRVIYLTLIVLSILGAVGATVAFLLLYEKVHFVSAEVIGFANRAGVFGWLATVTLMVLVSAALIAGFNRKFPIFGTPGVPDAPPGLPRCIIRRASHKLPLSLRGRRPWQSPGTG